jgi:hypothetical protein
MLEFDRPRAEWDPLGHVVPTRVTTTGMITAALSTAVRCLDEDEFPVNLVVGYDLDGNLKFADLVEGESDPGDVLISRRNSERHFDVSTVLEALQVSQSDMWFVILYSPLQLAAGDRSSARSRLAVSILVGDVNNVTHGFLGAFSEDAFGFVKATFDGIIDGKQAFHVDPN